MTVFPFSMQQPVTVLTECLKIVGVKQSSKSFNIC